MTGEDVVSLKEYIESRLSAFEKAIIVANTAMDKRLDGLNEIRAMLNDALATFISRDAVESKVATLQSQIDDLKAFRNEMKGKASQSQLNIAMFFSIGSMLLGMLSLLLKFMEK